MSAEVINALKLDPTATFRVVRIDKDPEGNIAWIGPLTLTPKEANDFDSKTFYKGEQAKLYKGVTVCSDTYLKRLLD